MPIYEVYMNEIQGDIAFAYLINYFCVQTSRRFKTILN